MAISNENVEAEYDVQSSASVMDNSEVCASAAEEEFDPRAFLADLEGAAAEAAPLKKGKRKKSKGDSNGKRKAAVADSVREARRTAQAERRARARLAAKGVIFRGSAAHTTPMPAADAPLDPRVALAAGAVRAHIPQASRLARHRASKRGR